VCPSGSEARFLAQGRFESTTCSCGSDSRQLVQGSSGDATCSCGSDSHLSTQDSSGTVTCCLSSSTHLLAQGSSRAVTCPVDGLYKVQAIQQPSHHDPHRGVCTCICQGTTRQGLLRVFAMHATVGPLNADETCGQAGCRAGPTQQTCSPITVLSGSTTLDRQRGEAVQCDCSLATVPWATCQASLQA
jgi:hypothetical protein